MLLHPRLVDLYNIGAGREQILNLVIHCGSVILDIVKGPGPMIFAGPYVLARRNCRARSAAGYVPPLLVVPRSPGSGLPLRLMLEAGLVVSMPSSAVTKRLE